MNVRKIKYPKRLVRCKRCNQYMFTVTVLIDEDHVPLGPLVDISGWKCKKCGLEIETMPVVIREKGDRRSVEDVLRSKITPYRRLKRLPAPRTRKGD